MKLKDKTGEVIDGKYGKMEIIKYRNNKDIDVKFENGYIKEHTNYTNFKRYGISNPLQPTVIGVGYYGIGQYVAKINDKHTKEYLVWRSMLVRCYQKEYQENHPTYQKCYVCKEWLNFQNFAKWFHENYYEIDGEIINIDKDFISLDKKVYSPNTCIFIPQSINKLLLFNTAKTSGLPVGVVCCGNKYTPKIAHKDKGIFVGNFENPLEAYRIYLKYKKQIMQEELNSLKDKMPIHIVDIVQNFIDNNYITILYDSYYKDTIEELKKKYS